MFADVWNLECNSSKDRGQRKGNLIHGNSSEEFYICIVLRVTTIGTHILMKHPKQLCLNRVSNGDGFTCFSYLNVLLCSLSTIYMYSEWD